MLKIKKKTTKEILSTPRRIRKSSNSEDEVTSPPKQKKSSSPTITPSPTPSTRMSNLKIGSSERKEKSTPKVLFPDNKKYQCARKALHSSASDNLPGRENELAELESFLVNNLDNKTSSSLYISGPPGTGKTACLTKIMKIPKLKQSFKDIYINCTSMKTPSSIYSQVLKELGIYAPRSIDKCKNKIEEHLITNHKMILLVLDEIDQLLSKNLNVLYTIFEWPSIPKSKIILIGIANALDLTTNKLSRLQGSFKYTPKLMHFTSYNKQQIVDIITKRLEEADVSDIFSNVAIHMLAAKIAAISGDVRRALDISRHVIEIAESQKLKSILQPAVDNAKNGGSPKKQQPNSDKLVDIKEVISILNSIYGGGMQNMEKDEHTFPIQQKLLICSLVLILNKGRNKDVTVGKLYEVYKKVCKKRNIHILDISEFVGLCSLIETRGILEVTGKKAASRCKVSLRWDEDEVEAALQDKKMMADIINDVSCL